jgi:hypothetical protein
MPTDERRKEHRYVVEAVQLALGMRRFPVIDIAISGARISCSPKEFEALKDRPCQLEFGSEAPLETFAIEPFLIRSTDLCVVLGYAAPQPDWESYIRRFDTFHVHELDTLLFD